MPDRGALVPRSAAESSGDAVLPPEPIPSPAPISNPGPPVARKAPRPHSAKRAVAGSSSSAKSASPKPDIPLVATSAGDVPPTSPTEAVAWMNARYAVVREGGRTVVLREAHDSVLDRRLIERFSFEDLKKYYMNRQVRAGTDEKPRIEVLGGWWLKQPDRRQFDGVTFAPGQETPGLYNLWKGFNVTPASGNWSRMRAHIAEVICGCNCEIERWVLAWLADLVQHPERQAEVALVMRGTRGTGKGVFGRAIGHVCSPHFVHVANPRHLLGNFNAHLQDAIVVFADEVFLAGDQQAEGVLKMIITEPMIPIERKHRDVVSSKNVIHLIIASNDTWVVPAGHDERRYAVLDVAPTHAQDHGYFEAIDQELRNGGYAAMLYDLQRLSFSDVNLREPPMTAALFEQKLHSLEPAQRWWYDKLMKGSLRSGIYSADEGWPPTILRGDLQRDYLAAMKEIGRSRDRSTETELGMKLRDLLPPGFPREERSTTPGSNLRPRLYALPDLATCRQYFASKYMKTDIAWPSDLSGQPASVESQPVISEMGRRNGR